jgi:hypothetical protein
MIPASLTIWSINRNLRRFRKAMMKRAQNAPRRYLPNAYLTPSHAPRGAPTERNCSERAVLASKFPLTKKFWPSTPRVS